MNRRVLLALFALTSTKPSFAGVVDWFNGVSIGMTMPKHDLQYIPHPPAPNPTLTLFDFWATWCAPCRETIPLLNALHAEFEGKGLAVIGVTDEQAEAVERFKKTVHIDYSIGLQGDVKLFKLVGIRARPYAVFVNPQSKVVWRGQPHDINSTLVESLLSAARA